MWWDIFLWISEKTEHPKEMPNWSIFTERVGDEAFFLTCQWIGDRPVMSEDSKIVTRSLDGDYAEFDVPILGVMPLL